MAQAMTEIIKGGYSGQVIANDIAAACRYAQERYSMPNGNSAFDCVICPATFPARVGGGIRRCAQWCGESRNWLSYVLGRIDFRPRSQRQPTPVSFRSLYVEAGQIIFRGGIQF